MKPRFQANSPSLNLIGIRLPEPFPFVAIATANSSGLFMVVVRLILAVLRSRCAGFACPACLAADTDPARPLLAPKITLSPGSLPVRQRQCRDRSQHAAEQPPAQVPFGLQKPIISRMFHQPPSRFHQPLLQARQGPVPASLWVKLKTEIPVITSPTRRQFYSSAGLSFSMITICSPRLTIPTRI